MTTETEVARIERGEAVGLAELGLRLDEAKQLTAALQAQIVPAQGAMTGERCRWCMACGRGLASTGHYPATFRSLFGDVPVRVRRLLVCPCQGPGEAKSFAALDLGKDAVAPELAYVTAKFAASAPFGKVATLLSELLPLAGALRGPGGALLHDVLADPQRPVPDRAGVLRPADRQQLGQEGRDLAERRQGRELGGHVGQFRRRTRAEIEGSEALRLARALT